MPHIINLDHKKATSPTVDVNLTYIVPYNMPNDSSTEMEMIALFEKTPDLVCIAGKDGYFKKINPAVVNTLGYTHEELLSRPVHNFIHPDDRERTAKERSRLLMGKALLNFQNRYVAKNGSVVWLEWTSVYLADNEVVFAIAKDITHTKQRQLETEEKFNTYKSLATHFKSRAEVDRKFLAHELHEEVAQLATLLKMNINGAKQELNGSYHKATDKMEYAYILSDLLVKTIRRISFSVSPYMLEDHGLNETLKWECQEFSVLNGIPCRFISNVEENQLSKEIRLDFFRICQQALSNVMEHAAASNVQVQLQTNGHSISLSISDDGKGFDSTQITDAPGLLNMQQLAISLNGDFTIDTGPGRGTSVKITVAR